MELSLPWLAPLREALAAEFADRPRVAALATADEDGRPHIRSVVCRRVTDDGGLWIVSDARSDKNRQLRGQPAAELAFWLPARREQFRLRVEVSIQWSDAEPVARASRQEMWRSLSDASRAMFLWPHPGRRRTQADRDFPQSVGADADPPAVFEVLVFSPDQVDHLTLASHPHRRTRWSRVGGWKAEEINP